jgi:predicted XRE-type DNA-binding protein
MFRRGVVVVATKFSDFMREIEAEARAEGPEAVAQLQKLRAYYRLGRQLAEARLRKKLSQKQVAELAHVDQGDISNLERGRGNPTVAKLSAVASSLGLELNLRRAVRTRLGRRSPRRTRADSPKRRRANAST